jgi:hypothetical protein
MPPWTKKVQNGPSVFQLEKGHENLAQEYQKIARVIRLQIIYVI